ncbi:MAG TPA: PEP-CTERM sorting domain-containing protein [Pirellulales bacterium]|jgi:probable HAF family extracellular repeat protein
MKFRMAVIVCCLGGYAMLPTAIASADTSYSVTDLGLLPGTTSADADAINDNGQIVGTTYLSSGATQAFLYEGQGPMQKLSTPTASRGYAINNSGQAVGDFNDRAAAFAADGTPIPLNGLNPQFQSSAEAINDSGEIVGAVFTNSSVLDVQAYSYSGAGPAQLLGTLGGTYSNATGINNSGQIVGMSYLSDGERHAFLYNGSGPLQDLGTLGGPYSGAEDINNHGQVVGFAAINGNDNHAFLYSGNGPIQDLGILPGESFGHAYAINDNGDIVGNSRDADLVWHAFIYTTGQMFDLNTLVGPAPSFWIEAALGINNLGQIVGYGPDATGQEHALLLTPVPEPTTLALCIIGLLGVLAHFGQRRTKVRSAVQD